MRSLPDDYQATYADAQGGVYWSLYLNGERINGGLSESEAQAIDSAGFYALWDKITREWDGKLVIDAETGLVVRAERCRHDL